MSMEIEFNALARFTCLGGECSRTCCQIWDIVIEPEKIRQWEKLKQEQDIDLIEDKTTKKETPSGPVYTIRLGADNHCVNLDENGWCCIHRDLGPKYLASICHSYPRYNYQNKLKKLTSAFMSCPEVVRLALFESRKKTEFRVKKAMRKNNKSDFTPYERLALDLDNFGHEILESDFLLLNVKIFHIADVIVKLYTAFENGVSDASYFRDVLGTKAEKLKSVQLHAMQTNPIDPVTAGSLWYNFFHVYLDQPNLVAGFDYSNSEFMKNYPEKITELKEYNDFYQYLKGYMSGAREFLRENHTDTFKRYLKVSFVNKGFAWNPLLEDFVAGYLYVIMPFCLIQILLWIKYTETGEITDEFIIDIISTVERMTDHTGEIKASLAQDQRMLELHRYHNCLLDCF